MSGIRREGEPLRFSLASPSELPQGLVAHTRHVVSESFEDVVESSPAVPGLHTLSFLGSARDDVDVDSLREELRGPCLALGIDCALLRGEMALRGPRLIVSDVDSTFIRGEVIEMLAEAAGSHELVQEITSRAMNGEMDFAESLALRVGTLAGLDVAAVREIGASVRAVPGADMLVRTAHANGCKVGLVSGGFHEVVDIISESLGIDHTLANRLGVAEGHLDGTTVGPVVTRESKRQALHDWAREDHAALEDCVAMGDGANDLSMMEIAGLSVAVCAKPIVLEYADAAVTQQRLDLLIAMLGWDAALVE